MTISTLKDLEKLIVLCRKRGVEAIKVDGIELSLGDVPQSNTTVRQSRTNKHTGSSVADFFGEVNETTKIDTPDELTEEQLLMWSAGTTSETV